ncbi:MAG: fused MFS/spermidine synthase [Deltaproteobacteria bacterium]|nr:fused MFS/spermidine synthase [Deltaproteobacteria bacterium]
MKTQGWVFAIGFALFAAGSALIALRTQAVPLLALPAAAPSEGAVKPNARQWASWIALAACPSWMLLAVTNHLCQEIAAVPFLWVLPLAIYLLSFILCFESDRWYRRGLFMPALGVLSAMGLLLLFGEPSETLAEPLVIYGLLLFTCGMVCHGELARMRPASTHLTSFYLAVSLGGAVGGVLVAVAAPLAFDRYLELDLGILATWLLAMGVAERDRARATPRRTLTLARVASAFVLLMLSGEVVAHLRLPEQGLVTHLRSFYGVLRVKASKDPSGSTVHHLRHGRVVHGYQFCDGPLRTEPVAYYTRNSAIGRTLANHPRREVEHQPLRVGVIGLGIGVLAAHAEVGDEYRFYEINPDVVRLARDPQLFTYLADSRARVEVVSGDARLALERELASGGSQRFDVFVVDAFSSDSIPAHLLTRQAFEVYLAHLRDQDSALAIHISNRVLDLGPVVYRIAEELGLEVAELFTQERHPGKEEVELPAHWMVVSRSKTLFEKPAFQGYTRIRRSPTSTRLWTDDYTNVLGALGAF